MSEESGAVVVPVGDKVPLTLRIKRYNPEVRSDPWWDEFEIVAGPMDRLLDALHEVKWHHDGTLALRRSCAHGICGSDGMLINGRNALACKVLVREVAPKVTVEPIRGLPVLKDLIVDMEPFFERSASSARAARPRARSTGGTTATSAPRPS